MTYDANKAADAFIQMLWDHHPEARDSRDTAELLHYAMQDMFNAMQREGINASRLVIEAGRCAQLRPADPRPGYFNPEPTTPTFDEALAAKCDADARMDEARALKGMV